MMEFSEAYEAIRRGDAGFYEPGRGLIKVWGSEAVQFLNGLVTNDVAKLEEGDQMLAAFPNAQGRLLAMVRIMAWAGTFLFETDSATHEKVFQNLHRFTYAGDFFAEDISRQVSSFELFNGVGAVRSFAAFKGKFSTVHFQLKQYEEMVRDGLITRGDIQITDELYELLRIENGAAEIRRRYGRIDRGPGNRAG